MAFEALLAARGRVRIQLGGSASGMRQKDTGTPKLDENNRPLILIADTELLKLELANGTYKFVVNRKGQRLFF